MIVSSRTQHSPTRAGLLALVARRALPTAQFYVHPRYTDGRPATVDIRVAIATAIAEFEARERRLNGTFGHELRAQAESLGLANIAFARWAANGSTHRLDLLTGVAGPEPAPLRHDEVGRVLRLRGMQRSSTTLGQPFTFADELATLEARAALHQQTIT